MAESSLSLSYNQLYAEVGDFLGVGRTVPNTDAGNHARITGALNSGLRQFYNPPPLAKGEQPHLWSFLQPVASFNTVKGTTIYALPDNFGGIIGELSYAAGKTIMGLSGQSRVAVITDLQVRAALTGNANQGPPAYCAVRPTAGATPTRWQLVISPAPDAVYTLSYQSLVIPETISPSNSYPLGGMSHAETILESCLACAEGRVDDSEKMLHHGLFMGCLAASVRLDRQVLATTATSPWPIAPPTAGLGLHYRELLSQVGDFLEFGWDPAIWSHEELNFADATVQEGVRKFYYPKPTGKEGHVYEWSFLRPELALVTNATQSDYNLPDWFSHFIGELAFTSPINGYLPLKVVALSQIRRMQGEPLQTGIPRFAAIAPRSVDGLSDPRYKLILAPVPDSAYTLTAVTKAVPPRLSDDNPYPLGGPEHAETIRTACIMAAEIRHIQLKPPTPMGRGRRVWIPRPSQEEFNDRLMASIGLDERMKPESLGYCGNERRDQWPNDYRESVSPSLSYNGAPL